MKLLLAPLLLLALPALAQNQNQNGTLLNISSFAEVSQQPDVANISAGVVTQEPTSTAAVRANAQQMTQVMNAVRKAGIAEKDVRTSGVTLNPQYTYQENQSPKITGYQASNTVDITVRDIARVGDVLDVLVADGSNQISGPNFSIDNTAPLYDQARRDALKTAQQRANTYASSLGMRVARIVSIDENNTGGSTPRPMMAAPMAKAVATPISIGESSVSVNLNVVFELK